MQNGVLSKSVFRQGLHDRAARRMAHFQLRLHFKWTNAGSTTTSHSLSGGVSSVACLIFPDFSNYPFFLTVILIRLPR
jgi:hypothetical protein